VLPLDFNLCSLVINEVKHLFILEGEFKSLGHLINLCCLIIYLLCSLHILDKSPLS
jgi:hypothetical protein